MDDEITAEELHDRIERDEPVRIVDIRSPSAFARGHIPGSENVPFAELTSRIEEFDGDGDVVTVCPHGEASVQAARLVASYEGFEGRVESLSDGIEGWAAAYDLERDAEPAEPAETDGGTGDADAPF